MLPSAFTHYLIKCSMGTDKALEDLQKKRRLMQSTARECYSHQPRVRRATHHKLACKRSQMAGCPPNNLPILAATLGDTPLRCINTS